MTILKVYNILENKSLDYLLKTLYFIKEEKNNLKKVLPFNEYHKNEKYTTLILIENITNEIIKKCELNEFEGPITLKNGKKVFYDKKNDLYIDENNKYLKIEE